MIRENFRKFMEEFWEVLCQDTCRSFCPVCGSKDILHYQHSLNVYNSDWDKIGEKDWGCDYTADQCQDCDWNNF